VPAFDLGEDQVDLLLHLPPALGGDDELAAAVVWVGPPVHVAERLELVDDPAHVLLGLVQQPALSGRPATVSTQSRRWMAPLRPTSPVAPSLLREVAAQVPADGRVPVSEGTEGKTLHPLDFAPYRDRPARELFAPEVIAADLDRLAGQQQPDGGWVVDYLRISPAGSLEWRGFATVEAVDILRRNGRLPA
jgi:hypothetical protein